MASHNGNGNGNGHGRKPPVPPDAHKPDAKPSPAERATAETANPKHARNTPVLPDTPLAPREQRFIDVYLTTLSPMHAAKAAGYQCTTKRSFVVMGQQVLRRPNVQAELQRAFIRRMERMALTQDRVVADLDLAAHVDPSEFFDHTGKLLPLHAVPRHIREAIIGMEFHEDGTLKHIRLRNNTPFHELLAKHTKVGVEKPPPSLLDVPAFILPEGTYMRIH